MYINQEKKAEDTSLTATFFLMENKPIFLSPEPHIWDHLCFLIVIMCAFFVSTSSNLSFDFYATSCPSAETMVKNTVRSASSMNPSLPGKLVRLLFHDCFVEGCDASVLIQGNGTERNDPANTSLGGFSVIDSAKKVLEIFCPLTVSCADILALAARDAVEFAGGPSIPIPMGRRDGRVSEASTVRPNIIDTSFSLDEMTNIFSSKGLSLDDLIILSGAHTIGSAHCNSFSDRFQVDSQGNLTLLDSSLNKEYAVELIQQCNATESASITVNNDPQTPQVFDNEYYKVLLDGKGLFQSDSALVHDDRTRNKVVEFANGRASFFNSWAESFLKLVSIEVKTGDEGEIRQTCSAING